MAALDQKEVRGLPAWRQAQGGGGPMPCPACGDRHAAITDSRAAPRGIRRRRCCSSCGERFTTYELHVVGGSALDDLLKSSAGMEKLSAIVAKAMAYDEIMETAAKVTALNAALLKAVDGSASIGVAAKYSQEFREES